MGYRFVKGHGTENDFVLLPDPDGLVHGALAAERVRALCDRRAGIGGDGVLRVIRSAALAELLDVGAVQSEWFMDYRNADGSLSEMCGNGLRVFVRFLVAEGLVAEEVALAGFSVATRAGDKAVRLLPDGRITIDLGVGESRGETSVTVGEREIPAVDIRTGNPHAVAFVGALAEAGALAAAPGFDAARYPEGVNVEFVTWVGPRHVAMRVFERGVGETRSCGTGAGAVGLAAARRDGVAAPPLVDTTYRVDVPGGALAVTWTAADRLLLTGPAELVAEGTTSL